MTAPRAVFFTGGTALRALSQTLAKSNLSAVHLVTTFDSGGSTAVLRKTFAIPAVGDLRNRLLALANLSVTGDKLVNFCASRIPADLSPAEARRALWNYANPNASPWPDLPRKKAMILWGCLQLFLKRMPPDFDARGASVGNLMLAGAYLEHNRDFGPALRLFANVLETRGVVLPITDANLHLAAKLRDGSVVVGQHLLKKPALPIDNLFLTVREPGAPAKAEAVACRPPILPEAAEYIARAELLCYPMGSFYSSVIANLLPAGVGRAAATSSGAKVFIPNSGVDPELSGITLVEQAKIILRRLREDAPGAPTSALLQYVLLDPNSGRYPGGFNEKVENDLRELGLKVVRRNVVWENNPQKHAPEPTLRALWEIAGGVA